jgi:dipeptidyl aminopeptidase/acylaminoacyl peptidase
VSRERPGRPLCLFGGSSGGDLVLLAAAELPELVDCVIDQAAIPDLIHPDTTEGWPFIHQRAVDIWGNGGLRDVSPMQRARDIRAPVLVIAPECDRDTSIARQQQFVAKLRRAKLYIQQAGPGYDTGHCEVTWESITGGWNEQQRFLAKYDN